MRLFEMLCNCFGRRPSSEEKPQAVVSPTPPAQAIPCAPVVEPGGRTPVPAQTHSVMACETVLGRDEHIAAYRFSLNRALLARGHERGVAYRAAYEDAFLRSLAARDLSILTEGQRVFLALSDGSLDHPVIETLPRKNVVLLLAMTPEPTLAASRLSAATERGFEVGLQLARNEEISTFGALIEWLDVDAAKLNGLQLRHLAGELRSYRSLRQRPLHLLARNLQTDDDFRFCHHAGFDFFCGAFALRRDGWRPPSNQIDRLRIIDVLNQIRGGADLDVIASALKPDPVLTFKLLRYINSAGIGLQQHVDSISRALIVLGRDRFYRWLSLLLFDFGKPSYREQMLTAQALGRARFMELLAGHGTLPAQGDALFMLGLFSLLDVLLGQTLDDIVRTVDLPVPVAAALQGEPGSLSSALALARAIEDDDANGIDLWAADCKLSHELITDARLAALVWCRQVGSATAAPDA